MTFLGKKVNNLCIHIGLNEDLWRGHMTVFCWICCVELHADLSDVNTYKWQIEEQIKYYIYIYRHGLFGEFSFSLTTKKWKHTTMNERLTKKSNLVWSMHFYSICFVFSKLQIFIFFLEFKNFEMFCWVCKIIGNGWYHVPSWQAFYADQKNFGVFNQLCMKGRTVARMSVATVVWH